MAIASSRSLNRRGRHLSKPVCSCSSFLGEVFLLLASLAPLGAITGCSGLVSGSSTNPPPSTLSITNVQATSTTTYTTQIAWTTNVAANSIVDYGTTTSYGFSTPLDLTMVTSHQVTVSGLAAGTTYYYQVQSTDSKNNNGKSGGHRFATAGVSISGTITPTKGGSGATVTLSGTSSATTTANGSGAYTFTGLASGSYGVTPSNAGYSYTPTNQNVTLTTLNMTGVNFSATGTALAPTITTQPVNQTVTAGQIASFNVAATGTAPLGYQWNKNGTAVSGATSSSYTTPATSSSDNGAQFTVVVSNTAGSVTSNAAALTVSAAPVAPSITAQPASQTVTAGQTATFNVAATGTAPLSYQWNKNGTAVLGATSLSYTTPATSSSDNGAQFTVVVSNTAGSVTSSAATLTVNAAPLAPSITTQPASQTVTAGQTATFTVVATGTAPLSYQWQKNSGNIAGATSSSYTTPATTTADSGSTFAVVVSNSAGTATSSAATLTVNPAPVAPTITTQSANQTVTAGQTATFTVVATGTAPLGYQWQKNGGNIAGATAASYTTPATTTADSGSTFRVMVTNTAGTATSSAATLTVNPAPVAPAITTQPVSQTVTAGQTATFSVTATGTAPLTYQWQKNGVAISGASSASYTTPATTTSDSGTQFTVAISNGVGTVISSAASLSVNPLLPTAAYAFNEGSGNTTLDASGNGNSGTLSGPSWTTAGHYANALSFNGTNAYVEAANSNSLNPGTAATFSAWVYMLAANADISSVINKWSQTIDDEYLFGLDSSNRLNFSWQTTGGNTWGQPSYYIVTGNSQVPLSTWTYITVVRNGPAVSFYINGSLDATFSAAADTNPFRSGINTLRIGGQNRGGMVRVLNGTIDEVRMYNQALTPAQIQSDMNTPISTPPVPPLITSQPVNQSVLVGQTATFSVTATGTAPLSYQWQKNGNAISGATSSSYTTPATSTSDNGTQFTVVVSNSAGSVTSSAATLTVNAITLVAPSITTQPTSQTVTAGQTASFSVAATGTAPLSYQWNKNGTAVSGATSSSYTTPPTSSSDNGAQFTVVVGNTAGSVTSSAATLTVNAATYLLSVSPTSLSFGNINPGASSTLAVTLTNSGNSNVTISNVSISGAGFNASGVSTGTGLTPGQTAALNVTFAPAATGSVTGSVTVTSNATNSPTTIALSGSGIQATFTAWVVPGLVRVGQTDAPGTTSSIALSGARGETVDAQVIVQGPAGGLSNVNLSASALTGPNGVTIPASSFVLYREYYVTVQGSFNAGGNNQPLGAGTYPEPLIPFVDPETGAALSGSLQAVPATIAANQNQPFWIDLNIPRGATTVPPGTYTGRIAVTSNQGNIAVPVTLTLWNFELPLKPSELTMFTTWVNTGSPTNAQQQALAQNRVFNLNYSSSQASTFQSQWGLNRADLGGTFGYNFVQCNGSLNDPIPSQSAIASAASAYPAGLPLELFVSDETIGCSAAWPNIRTIANNAHAAGVKILDTVPPNSNLFNYVDYWVILPVNWPSSFAGVPGTFWSYTSCNVGNGSNPRWDIDFAPINERLQAGFLNQTQGATGLLYYAVDRWNSGDSLTSWNSLNTCGCGCGVPGSGDGIMLYPPSPIGSSEAAPGIRLKNIRDGIQDYEYAQILKNLGQVPFLNSVIVPIATSFTNWTHDPTALENARQQLGQQLHLLHP